MNPRIQLRHLLAFRAIMNTGSISAASSVINLSQPAISRLLALLEDELGFKLFYRRGRGLVPTQEGTAFFLRIEGTLSGIDDIPLIANDIAFNKSGRMRLCSIGPLLYSTYVPSAVAAFRHKWPEARMTLDMRRREDIEEWVASRQADLAFTLGPVGRRSIASRELITVAAVALVPKTHAMAGRSTLSLEDFAGESLILPKENVRLRQFIEAMARAMGVTLQVEIETSTAVTSCHLITQGVGVGIADPFSVSGLARDDIRIIRLVPDILLKYLSIWPVDREPTAQGEAFLAELEATNRKFFDQIPEAEPSSTR